MTIYMCNQGMRICITNRKLVKGDFLTQLEYVVAKCQVDRIILREKDLSESDYEDLGLQVKQLCDRYQVECFFHNHLKLAKKHQAAGVHLSFSQLQECSRTKWKGMQVGCSVHSVEEAIFAQSCGADYLIVSPIYETDCKRGVRGKTPWFITEIKSKVNLPVYALGGITKENEKACIDAGANGVCRMSAYMNEIMEESE